MGSVVCKYFIEGSVTILETSCVYRNNKDTWFE